MRPAGSPMFGMRATGSFSVQLEDRVMTPTHAHRIVFHVIPKMDWNSITVDIMLEVDGEETMMANHRFTEDDLANAYEGVHHRVHGYDARGLDPREGPTRLKR